jgi:hypothetical protein
VGKEPNQTIARKPCPLYPIQYSLTSLHPLAFVSKHTQSQSMIIFRTLYRTAHYKGNPIYVFLFWKLRGLSPNFHIHVSVIDLYIPRTGPHISLQQNRQIRSWKYLNLSLIYECRNWGTEHYNSVLEITVSFLGVYKWEPDIYIGFSPALHLQCRLKCDFHCTMARKKKRYTRNVKSW